MPRLDLKEKEGVGASQAQQLRSTHLPSERLPGLLGATEMLSGTFPVSEANKEVFWEEKGMPSLTCGDQSQQHLPIPGPGGR